MKPTKEHATRDAAPHLRAASAPTRAVVRGLPGMQPPATNTGNSAGTRPR